MRRIISCQFNIDTACVDVEYENGFVLSIYTPTVEDAVAHTIQQRSELDWLIYNDPLAYRTGYERKKRGISESSYAVIEWKEIRPYRVVDRDGFSFCILCNLYSEKS